MSLKKFQLEGKRITDRETQILSREMMRSYALAERDIIRKINIVYAKHLQSVDKRDIYNTMIQHDRLNKLLREVQATYSEYARQAGQQINQVVHVSMSNSYYRQQYALNWLASDRVGLSFSILRPELIEAATVGQVDAWSSIAKKTREKIVRTYGSINQYLPQYGTLNSLMAQKRLDDIKKIQQAITRGLIQGQGIREMSSNIQDVMGNAAYQAERIARTEAHRAGAIGDRLSSIDARDQGLQIKRLWVATLDDVTRDRHADMDGELAEVDGDFKGGVPGPGMFGDPGDDINCRCVVVDTVVRDGEAVPPTMRLGRNPVADEDGKFRNEAFEWKTFDSWAESNGLKQNKYGEYYKK